MIRYPSCFKSACKQPHRAQLMISFGIWTRWPSFPCRAHERGVSRSKKNELRKLRVRAYLKDIVVRLGGLVVNGSPRTACTPTHSQRTLPDPLPLLLHHPHRHYHHATGVRAKLQRTRYTPSMICYRFSLQLSVMAMWI